MGTGDANREALPSRIGDRYRVERLLGRGGMASVYQVFDEVRGRQLALKRLYLREASTGEAEGSSARRSDGVLAEDEETLATEEARVEPYAAAARSHAGQLFEREFDTLSQLVHPRIIEVYDYHRDSQGPYYTMELLDGGDLRERSPLPWREASRVLCDVCSAISLLHSRRLVHRDLTPLNIRCTRAGSAKLFDFGSMTPFGRSRHVVGTPPFVAPEALHGEIVDAQTDLYALGASAYFALTGRHAYPARQLLELPEVWRHAPRPPSAYASDIPPALDELVLWLLELAPSARPPSAAEIMERLSAIAGLDLREDLVVRQSYLSTPILVGREHSIERLRKRLQAASEGSGGTLVVTGPRGAGRTRLLDACVLEAQLMGAVVLRADEADGGERWSAARSLLRQVLAQAPELALPLVGKRAANLAHLLPEVETDAAQALDTSPGSAGELAFRANTQLALRDLLFDVAQQQFVVLAIDDAHQIDEPSAAFLALIARETRSRRMLLLASVERSEHVRGSHALQWLLQAGEAIRLKNLTPEQTAILVQSLFGDVPNARLAADRIHTASAGNPSAIMQIARQLVAAGEARYAAGNWTLPAKLDPAELALDLETNFDLRVRGSALWLARSVAACREHVAWNECLALSTHRDARRLIGELDELVAAGILSAHDQRYFVGGAGMRAALLRGLPATDAQAIHVRVAELYANRGADAFRVAHHGWLGGETARALEVLIDDVRATRVARSDDPAVRFDYVQSLPEGWQATYRGLIDASRTLGRSRRDQLDLQLRFLSLANVTAGYEPAIVRDVIAQLRQDSGLAAYESLDSSVPADQRMMRALALTRAAYEETPEQDRGMPVQPAIGLLGQVVVQAMGMAGRALDYELLASLPDITPLAQLSAVLSIVQLNVENTRDLLGGHLLRGVSGTRRLLAHIEEPGATLGMSDLNVQLMTLALHWSTGIVEASLGDDAALERADRIEASPIFAVNAWRVRALFALFQGDLPRADACRVQTELLQIQNSPPQLFEGSHGWQMVLGYFAAHDLLRTKQCISDLEVMAKQFPPWQPAVHFAKGAYQSLRGDGVRALAEFERALSVCTIGRHVMWPAAAGGVLSALNAKGEFSESVRRGARFLEQLRAAEISELEYLVGLPLARAEIELGHFDRARRLLDAAIENLDGPGRRSVYLGRAHELEAWLALRMRNAEAFAHALAACHPHYAANKNPRLRAKLERLQRAARKEGLSNDGRIEATRSEPDADGGRSMLATVLSSCEDSQERADRALVLLTRHTRCRGGFLYTLRREGPELVASRGEREPPAELGEMVNRFVVEQVGPPDIREITRSQYAIPPTTETSTFWCEPDGTQFVPMLLSHRGELGVCVTAVAVMWLRPESRYRVPTKLLTSLSRSLQES